VPKPIPGKTYTVSAGDTLRGIARRAYGNDQAALIAQANTRLLAGRPVSLEGLPTIRPGDVLELPGSTSRYDGRMITADFDSELSVKIGSRLFKGVTASRVERGLNSIADGFTFDIPFDYRDRELVDAVRPYSFQEATLYIGGEPYITARIMKPTIELNGDANTATIETRTIPGDTIECMSSHGALDYKNQTLLEIGNDIARRYNLRAFSTHGDSDRIKQAIKEVTETDFEFLSRLASQKGFLVTSSRDGNILFTRAAVDAKPVASLVAGNYPVQGVQLIADGTKRHSTWYGYAEVSTGEPARAFLRDESIPVFRPFAFSADESEADNIEQAVRWRMAKSIADATNVQVTVSGYRNPDGQLWEENMKVTLLAPHVCIFQATDFIVQSVTLSKSESGGDIAIMPLVLPGAYNFEIPNSFPWDGYYS